MKTIMFYSHKGGSGRTVAVANVAAALAKLGKRAAVIDLDFEAPGLHHVFGTENLAQSKHGTGIQHYLKASVELEELEQNVFIDIFSVNGPPPLNMSEVPEGACLLYIMSSPKIELVDSRQPRVAARMKELISLLANKHNIEFLLIDAASGVREAYAIAADVSDEMLIFFRWSTQHVQGTLKMVRYFALMKEYNQTPLPFKLISSTTPSDTELAGLGTERRDMLVRLKESTRSRIEQVLRDCEVIPSTIFHDIPEMVTLKWKEGVTVFSPGPETEYEQLARKLLGATAGTPSM